MRDMRERTAVLRRRTKRPHPAETGPLKSENPSENATDNPLENATENPQWFLRCRVLVCNLLPLAETGPVARGERFRTRAQGFDRSLKSSVGKWP